MAVGYIELLPQSAVMPDGSTNNVGPGMTRRQGSQATRKLHAVTLDFDGAGAVIESCWWVLTLPGDYASGGALDIYWMANATANAVKWQAQVGAITPADADTPLEHALASAATVTTNVNSTEARRLTKSSITLTMDSATASDLLYIVLFRDPADGADTAAVDAEVLAALFSYTTA
jgi:hypothetical protein